MDSTQAREACNLGSSPSRTTISPARAQHKQHNTTNMHISINTLIAIAAAIDFATFIGIIVVIAR